MKTYVDVASEASSNLSKIQSLSYRSQRDGARKS